jgi:hypothetical protein|tara:strand:+ start:358 stop:564 length:207 start_codon:yes stop_codon:yes gene_type:complete
MNLRSEEPKAERKNLNSLFEMNIKQAKNATQNNSRRIEDDSSGSESDEPVNTFRNLIKKDAHYENDED